MKAKVRQIGKVSVLDLSGKIRHVNRAAEALLGPGSERDQRRTVQEVLYFSRDEDRAALSQQAERVAAAGMSVLEFRRGRGLCLFAPGALDDVAGFVHQPRPQRADTLSGQIALGANRVLNLNEERKVRLNELQESLRAAVARATPTARDAMVAQIGPLQRARAAGVV